MSCKNCYFRALNEEKEPKKVWKCKITGKTFNHPKLHGWLCSLHSTEEEFKQMAKKLFRF